MQENSKRPLNIEGESEKEPQEIGKVGVGEEIPIAPGVPKPEVKIQPISPTEKEIKKRWEEVKEQGIKPITPEIERAITKFPGEGEGGEKIPSTKLEFAELAAIKGSPFELQKVLRDLEE